MDTLDYQIITERENALCAEMEAFVRAHSNGHFMQSPRWRLVKEHWQWRGVLARQEGAICGTLSLLIRPLPGGWSLLYAPRGPVCDRHQTEVLACLVAGTRAAADEVRGCCLILDPDAEESDLAAHRALRSLGFVCQRSEGFGAIQPRFVFRLPLAGRTEAELLAGCSRQTRYQIRLAERRGVTVSHWAGDGGIPDGALDDFCRLMEETGRRDHFLTRPREYFAQLLGALGADGRLYLARLGDRAIAGSIAVRYGDKVWYLYGASSGASEDRRARPNYLLQWEMMRWALESRARLYDFRGVPGREDPDDPLSGLYRFKKGFGGRHTAFAGQYTLVLRRGAYAALSAGLEMNRLWRKALRRLAAG